MLRILTQKLKSQSLNEIQPVQQTQSEANIMKIENTEDRDSGTESDDENAELQDIGREAAEGGLQGREAQAPTPSLRSPTFSNSMTHRRSSSLNLVNAPTLVSPLEGDELHDQSSMDSGCLPNDAVSSHCSSDFERCSLDYELGSSVEFDRNSSEEELHTINHHNHRHNNYPRDLQSQAEKRTWAQANRCSSCCENSGSSSDEEIKDLLLTPPQPLSFSSSPPMGVQKLARALPPKLFLANVTPAHACLVSPRKRHRQTSLDGSMTVMQRPCLDFEKMQKTCMLRKHMTHGLNRARIVKIKSFNGTSRPPKLMCDPAVFSFRSISMYTPLTPVEEPSVAF